MTTFDDRQKGFENKFALDEELEFKANARRNKLLGLWAAERLGKSASEAEHYAKDVVMADFESNGDQDVAEKLAKDFQHAGLAVSLKEILVEMERLLPVARQQILGDTKK